MTKGDRKNHGSKTSVEITEMERQESHQSQELNHGGLGGTGESS